MVHPAVIALLAADVVLLLLVCRQPLSRRFDDSDRGCGRVVELLAIRRPSILRAMPSC